MFLAIDIGNTNITLGVYEGERLRATWRVATVHDRMPDEYGILLSQLLEHKGVPPEGITGVAIASVVPSLTGAFRQVSLDYLHQEPLVVDAGVKTGVRIRYENPARSAPIASWIAPRCRPSTAGRPVSWISARPRLWTRFRGRVITWAARSRRASASPPKRCSPGLQALSGGACAPARAIGTNTVTAMQSGIFFGYVGLVEGLVARFRRELGDDRRSSRPGAWRRSSRVRRQ